MLNHDFLLEFKKTTELNWSQLSIDPAGYGFQFQRGMRWNPGLSNAEITDYENVLGVQFPLDFRAFLKVMNGTGIPTLNVYGRLRGAISDIGRSLFLSARSEDGRSAH